MELTHQHLEVERAGILPRASGTEQGQHLNSIPVRPIVTPDSIVVK